jgi:hypothetical protein
MATGTTISGTVTVAATGSPVSGVCAIVMTSGRAYGEAGVSGTKGAYTIYNLAPGSYVVEFPAGGCIGARSNYAEQFYNGTSSGTSSLERAVLVPTSVASPATNINAEMVANTTNT